MTANSSLQPRVSVALCTCNGAAYLGAQLESIAAQSCPVDEIIVCDDNSTDQTVAILRSFATTSAAPLTVIENPKRLGVTRNFEQAISHCRGQTILLCDQDDRWHVNKVRVLLEHLDQQNAALAFSNAQVVLHNLQPAGYRLWDSIWFDESEQRRVREGDALPVLLRHAVAAGSTLAFRADYLPLILPIPDLPHCHDIWITLLIACVGRIVPVNQDLIQYRLHGSNEVGMRRYDLLGQLRMARHQIRTNAFGHLADLHTAAHDRLASQTRWPVPPSTLKLLLDKVRHSQLRHALPSLWIDRLRVVGGELRRGNYLKYSYGYKSVAQDLFLR